MCVCLLGQGLGVENLGSTSHGKFRNLKKGNFGMTCLQRRSREGVRHLSGTSHTAPNIRRDTEALGHPEHLPCALHTSYGGVRPLTPFPSSAVLTAGRLQPEASEPGTWSKLRPAWGSHVLHFSAFCREQWYTLLSLGEQPGLPLPGFRDSKRPGARVSPWGLPSSPLLTLRLEIQHGLHHRQHDPGSPACSQQVHVHPGVRPTTPDPDSRSPEPGETGLPQGHDLHLLTPPCS